MRRLLIHKHVYFSRVHDAPWGCRQNETWAMGWEQTILLPFRVVELRMKSGADWSTIVTTHCRWGSGQPSQLCSLQWSHIPQGNCVSSSETKTGLWLGTLYWPSPRLSQHCCCSWEHQPGHSHVPLVAWKDGRKRTHIAFITKSRIFIFTMTSLIRLFSHISWSSPYKIRTYKFNIN